jgi:hypothetical protein
MLSRKPSNQAMKPNGPLAKQLQRAPRKSLKVITTTNEQHVLLFAVRNF